MSRFFVSRYAEMASEASEMGLLNLVAMTLIVAP